MTNDQDLAAAAARHRDGDMKGAAAGYQAILARDPKHAKAKHLLGLIRWHEGALIDARDLIQAAIQHAPTDADAARDLAGVLYSLGDGEGAIAALRRSLALLANQPTAALDLGRMLLEVGRPGEAVEVLRQAETLAPNNVELLLTLATALRMIGHSVLAIPVLQRVLTLDPTSSTAYAGLGMAADLQKQPAEAERCYREALRLQPDQPLVQMDLANILHHQGRLAEAEALLRAAIALDPNLADARNNLGLLLAETGRTDDAITEFAMAEAAEPGHVSAAINLGNALRQRGDLAGAAAAYERAQAHGPDAIAAINHASVLLDLGRPVDALAAAERAHRLDGTSPIAMAVLADAMVAAGGNMVEAAVLYRRALLADETDATTVENLLRVLVLLQLWDEALPLSDRAVAARGHSANVLTLRSITLRHNDRLTEALAIAEEAVTRDPDSAPAAMAKASALASLGRHEDAVVIYQTLAERGTETAKTGLAYSMLETMEYDSAIEAARGAGEAGRNLLAIALHRSGRREEALDVFETGLRDRPTDSVLLLNMGNLLRDLGRTHEAEAAYARAVALDPTNTKLLNNHANALMDLGRVAETVDRLRSLLEQVPDWAMAHSNLVFNLGFDERASLDDLMAERARWWQRHGAALAPAAPTFRGTRDPNRRLRVGYVSADFRHHAAGSVALAFIPHHDPAEVELVMYHHTLAEDDVTERFKAVATLWRRIERLSEEALAAQIHDDAIDVLVDLSGHTAGNRLLAFARRPAPIQASGWGSLGGTGLKTIDYTYADPGLIPLDLRASFTETVVDLPSWIVLEPPVEAPAVADLPSAWGRPFTFGSFNRLAKISDTVVALWAEILTNAPQSRLLMKAPQLNSSLNRDRMSAAFAQHGIDPTRIEFRGGSNRAVHLGAHADIDVLLDPFPQNGGVTTLESLWMGVPVVTQLGVTPGSRATGALQRTLGLEAFNAASAAEYRDIAVGWSQRGDDLRAIRLGLRERMRASPLVGGPAYTRAVEAAYRQAWRDYCAR